MTDRKRQIVVVAALLGLSCTVQAGLIRRATVPGQDAVGFVQFAQQIQRAGLIPTLRTEGQQPLFPVSIWLAHRALESTIGPMPSAWAISAQLAAAVPLILAVVPVYLIALRLVGPSAAAAGSLLFCVLPEVARLGADGLSDSSHLLFFAVATWSAVKHLGVQGSGLRVQDSAWRGSAAWLVVGGSATAVALLARVEVLVLPAALAVAVLALQLQPRWRQPWSRVVAHAGCFILGFGLIFGPYLAAVGSLGPRAAVARALGTYQPREDSAPRPSATIATAGAAWKLPDGRPMSFAYKEPSLSSRRRGYPAAIGMFADELADAFGYWMGAFTLLGLWHMRRTPCRRADRFVQILFLLYCLAVLHHTVTEGYVSARHLVPLVAAGAGCAGHGLMVTSRWLAQRVQAGDCPKQAGDCPDFRAAKMGLSPLRTAFLSQHATAACLIVTAAVAACLAGQIQPLHAARAGHRAAGEWLALESDASDAVLDTRGWTGLYSGRRTFGYRDAWAAFRDPRLTYLVLEQWELDYASDRSRTLRALLGQAGEAVAAFPSGKTSAARARAVVVYRWRPERLAQRPAAKSLERPTK